MRLSAIIILILIAFVVLFFLGLSRVPDMLANNLSKKLGVSVSIDSMSFRPSKIEVKKIEIGNPRGYSLPKAFSAEEIEIKAPITNYFKEEIVIDQVDVDNIYLGLEFDTTTEAKGNWSRILQHFQKEAHLDEMKGKKILIKKMVFTNIHTELLFRSEGGKVQKLPMIKRIELTNISTQGGFPTDQLMGSVLGQMLKEVFIQQNLNNALRGLLFDSPGKAVDNFLSPFKGLFNAVPLDQKKLNDPEGYKKIA